MCNATYEEPHYMRRTTGISIFKCIGVIYGHKGGNYTLRGFIGIDGAFLNINNVTLVHSLELFNGNQDLINWVEHMLRNR